MTPSASRYAATGSATRHEAAQIGGQRQSPLPDRTSGSTVSTTCVVWATLRLAEQEGQTARALQLKGTGRSSAQSGAGCAGDPQSPALTSIKFQEFFPWLCK